VIGTTNSLGVVLWEMVSGHAVFRGSPAEVKHQRQHAPLRLEQLEPGIPGHDGGGCRQIRAGRLSPIGEKPAGINRGILRQTQLTGLRRFPVHNY
jgi:hypothetical protein